MAFYFSNLILQTAFNKILKYRGEKWGIVVDLSYKVVKGDDWLVDG